MCDERSPVDFMKQALCAALRGCFSTNCAFGATLMLRPLPTEVRRVDEI